MADAEGAVFELGTITAIAAQDFFPGTHLEIFFSCNVEILVPQAVRACGIRFKTSTSRSFFFFFLVQRLRPIDFADLHELCR